MLLMETVMSNSKPKITVCTPVYNAEDRTEALHSLLQAQTYKDFEWIIVTDERHKSSVESLQADFPITVLTQKFNGCHVAINKAVESAGGEFFTVLQAAAKPHPAAFERLLESWNSIPQQERPYFASVACVVSLPDGSIDGSKFPASPFDSNSIETGTHYGISGRKWGLILTESLRAQPYPVFKGETFVPEELVLNRIGRNRLTRYLNDPLISLPPQPAKLERIREWAKNPQASALFYNELSEQRIPLAHRIRASAQYVRYSMHAGVIPDNIYKQANKKLITFFMLWPGLVLYKRDAQLLNAGRKASP